MKGFSKKRSISSGRRHRHLCARVDRKQRGGRRPRQRRDPRGRGGAALKGSRRRKSGMPSGGIEAADAGRGNPPQYDAIDIPRRQHISRRRGPPQDRAQLPLHDGSLTWPDRNALLASMTAKSPPWCAQQLPAEHSRSRSTNSAVSDSDSSMRLMQTLESVMRLDRAVEFLPDDSVDRRNSAARPSADAARDCGAAA